MESDQNSAGGVDATADAVGAGDIPPDYKVVLFNDDYTTKEFVVQILERIFHKSGADAVSIMEKVHVSGSAVVGVYTYDIAMTRVQMTTESARSNGFPLRCECGPA